jgi:hypothetical protein
VARAVLVALEQQLPLLGPQERMALRVVQELLLHLMAF